MAKVHFAPYSAIKYVGSKAKDFNTSLARPKPTLKKGDIVIVLKKDAFNLVSKGYGEFVAVDTIEFKKGDIETAAKIEALEAEVTTLQAEVARLHGENAALLLELATTPECCGAKDTAVDEAFGAMPEVLPESLEIVLDDVVLDETEEKSE
ncbi:MAG: hypothetical protein RQ763_00090 [Sulfurimonas sp.]|uniref:hypothetical protein n=1 Tax=Sulfurimonas sp. TaxID=2022749 RepID=UPI0028CC8357|nr:hypothetical protein [Sulfurimonas sp.]MDT8337572.1 hypothetical protein [Sulfurimonas sp.]